MIGRNRDGSRAEVQVDLGAVRAREAIREASTATKQAMIIKGLRGIGERDSDIAKVMRCCSRTVQRTAKLPTPDLTELLRRDPD